jgi:hypothetical protein
VNDAQTWTIIAAVIGMLGFVVATTMRVVRTEIRSLDHKLTGRIDGVEARLNGRLDSLEVRFDGLEAKLDRLDRDVQVVINRLMGGSA